MTIPDGYRLISPDPSRAREILHVDGFAFAFSVPDKDADFIEHIVPWERARAIEIADPSRGKEGTLAAVHASFEFQTRVPGGRSVPTAGLTWVGVHPGHRRRGLLRTMIDDHFSRSLARGEVISTLWAAETQIYQRFGYGLATIDTRVELGRGTELRDLPGADDLTVEIDSASADAHGATIEAIQARMMRPGTVTAYTQQMRADLFMDLESDREGAEELRVVLVRDGDDPRAWALFQRKGDWSPTGPDGKVRVRAWGALDALASHRLWRVLVDFDLMAKTNAGRFAQDDPLLHLLKDVRTATMTAGDNLWVRILDVAGALQGRGYDADCDVTFALEDAVLPDNAGTWRLRASGGEATVTRDPGVDPAQADVRIGAQELGAVYLGGTTLSQLHRAGLVDERREGAVGELSRAMASDLKPVANFGF